LVPTAREPLRRIKPEILSAHFVSGYRTTARLAAFRPWVLSVWGSDIYDFPQKSVFHRWLVAGNLSSADAVASTSHCMADEVWLVAPDLGEIAITPFGVDMDCFAGVETLSPVQRARCLMGTAKTMAPKYGFDTLATLLRYLLGGWRFVVVAKFRMSGCVWWAEVELPVGSSVWRATLGSPTE